MQSTKSARGARSSQPECQGVLNDSVGRVRCMMGESRPHVMADLAAGAAE